MRSSVSRHSASASSPRGRPALEHVGGVVAARVERLDHRVDLARIDQRAVRGHAHDDVGPRLARRAGVAVEHVVLAAAMPAQARAGRRVRRAGRRRRLVVTASTISSASRQRRSRSSSRSSSGRARQIHQHLAREARRRHPRLDHHDTPHRAASYDPCDGRCLDRGHRRRRGVGGTRAHRPLLGDRRRAAGARAARRRLLLRGRLAADARRDRLAPAGARHRAAAPRPARQLHAARRGARRARRGGAGPRRRSESRRAPSWSWRSGTPATAIRACSRACATRRCARRSGGCPSAACASASSACWSRRGAARCRPRPSSWRAPWVPRSPVPSSPSCGGRTRASSRRPGSSSSTRRPRSWPSSWPPTWS